MDSEKKDPNVRRAQILVEGTWTDVKPLEIKKGMTFRLFEPDGTPVFRPDGQREFIASKDTYLREDGVAVTMTEE